MSFSYVMPDGEKFLKALIVVLRSQEDHALASMLSESKLALVSSGTYAPYAGGTIYNAFAKTANFGIPYDKYEVVTQSIGAEGKKIIREASKEVMPSDSGYEVTSVKFSISMEESKSDKSPEQDLENITNQLPTFVKAIIIPDDFKQQAIEMSKVYFYTYCAENSIRAFIESVVKKKLGGDLSKLKLNGEMHKKIAARKEAQVKKKWLSPRGNSDIFYLDIEDLARVIGNNWDIFKDYFDSFEWIQTNINEIADCRNPVAHHCVLQDHEKETIRLNFIKILRQISDEFK